MENPFHPSTYAAMMAEEIPAYAELQSAVASAASHIAARRILDLGTGTGITAVHVLSYHPSATLVGVDENADMLAAARQALPESAELRLARLQDPLPLGPFDLVVSALAVHHLDDAGKAELFRRVADVLSPGGIFVLGDLIIPENPVDVVTPIDGVYDLPSRLDAQSDWLTAAGLKVYIPWVKRDLAVLMGARQT